MEIKSPFVIYVDFESILVSQDNGKIQMNLTCSACNDRREKKL